MIENLIIGSLLQNEAYAREILPHVKEEYFTDEGCKLAFAVIQKHVAKYNRVPSKAALIVEINATPGDIKCKAAVEAVEIGLKEEIEEVDGWLRDQTEQFCKDRALYLALMESITIANDADGKKSRGAIIPILQDAIALTFDTDLGHDFIRDAADRYDFYHRKQERIPFDIELLNRITKGGLPKKTLTVIIGGTGVGKSLVMCHFAAANLLRGLNVLYITLEMAEERIAERIDANLLDMSVDDIMTLPQESYFKKIERVKGKTTGRLIIEEYPTTVGNVSHFRHLLNELKTKEKFTPDIIYVDYINICASSRLRLGPGVNSYAYIKAIAEELRGLAVEFEVPIVSATQTTRTGYTNTDPGLEDTAESFGLPHTVDLMLAIVADENMMKLGQLLFKQLKNRYSDPSQDRRFMVGVDRSKFRLYNVEQQAQEGLIDTETGEISNATKFNRSFFDGFS